MSPPSNLEHLSSAELRELVIALVGKVAALERAVTVQRDEIARLKNVPRRPAIKPSGMENATQPKPPTGRGKGRKSGGNKTARRVIDEDRVIKAAAPCGSRFKGYEDFVVQDLVFRPLVVRYRRERWLDPGGGDHHRPNAGGRRRPLRRGAAALRAGPAPSGTGHGAAGGLPVARGRVRHLASVRVVPGPPGA